MKYIASLSGGKDSTAMVLRLIADGWPLDEIVYFDTGWEFPQMRDHLKQFEAFVGRSVTRLYPAEPFDYLMQLRPIVRRKRNDPMHGKIYRRGYGWPSHFRRWCTRTKLDALDLYCGDALVYVGIAADEPSRRRLRNYPLIAWGMTETDCLDLCFSKGFDWSGLYSHFSRLSCFCCPLKGLDDFRTLRDHFPQLWTRMLTMGDNVTDETGQRFSHGRSIRDLDARFACESHQCTLALGHTT